MEEKVEYSPAEILSNEDALLRGVLRAAEDIKGQTRLIRVKRPGANGEPEVRFEFGVRGLTDQELDELQQRYMEYDRTRSGIMIPDMSKQHAAKQRSMEIYAATVDEDRARLWDSKKLQEALLSPGEWKDLDNARRGAAVVDHVLYAGEKADIIDVVEKIGNVETRQLAKN